MWETKAALVSFQRAIHRLTHFPGAIGGAAVATQFIVCANPAELLVHHVIGWRNGSSFIYVLHPLVQSSLC